ncbi:MAG: (2Fe-2S)-binding protein [Armatimonadetes bacterium]|nr:(2Fe-2S)-binding protein [Armatimonadota bacterium]MDE2206771.1 (2Fe-2S)-binding protein [Armatimonadota bacterium]
MPVVTVDGETKVECEWGKKLVLCLEDGGIDILHRCGGLARCTTCRVVVLDGSVPPMSIREQAALADPELIATYRLSCQLRVEGDLVVSVVNRATACGLSPGPRPAP